VVKGGALLPTPFLDISGQVSNGSEQGLLGLAFDPQYASNGRFVVNYTNPAGDTRISTFRVSAGNADVADPASEHVILAVAQPYPNHNGGQVAFGPDGYLYIGLGDGGSSGDPQHHAQDRSELLGSMLRVAISVDGTGYTVPADNPFVGQSGVRGEIWSYGLRNPWRFSFDRATGDLYIADVGESRYEEIDVTARTAGGGQNYGWNVMEGKHCYGTASCDQTGLVQPALEYDHGQGCSVSGGYVYRGTAVPALAGTYLYSDFCQGWVRSFRWQNGTASDQRDWPALRPGGSVPSFGEDSAGELYVIDAGGSVYRVVAGS
jgi:glucose/arabinose dehydrogenase